METDSATATQTYTQESLPASTPNKKKSGKRLQQSSKPLMNKLETAFYERVRSLHPDYPPVRPQAKTYRLANGVRFTPDFTASRWPYPDGPARETAWEVKGPHAWDDSLVKLKTAAAIWPEVVWWFVQRKDGEWVEQRILP